MSMHAVGRHAAPLPGMCVTHWDWEDVRLACDQDAIPGGVECCEHLIERVHATPGDPFADEPVRSFGPSVVSLDEVTRA